MGYRYAMDKYRANDIVNEVNLRNRDTWNMYQTKDLPDELAEWADHTQTGFPIGVYPRSNVIFDVQVDDVPSRVCKQVLNMNLVGPLFIWTPNGEGKTIYNGTNANEVCGEEDTTSSMVFTTTLESYGNTEGLRGDLTDERGQPMRYCVEDEDCRSCERCGEAYTCESVCSDDQPICMQKEGNAAKCVECELTSDCSIGQICDDTTYTCQPIQVECPEGTFRSKNGACVPCNEPTNIIISPEKFTAPGIEDELTGEEMCNACATATTNKSNRNLEIDKEGTMYCSYTCTTGVSFQRNSVDSNGQRCRNCYSEERASVAIANAWFYDYLIEQSKAKQCLACENHFWIADAYANKTFCLTDKQCGEGQFKFWWRSGDFECANCKIKPPFYPDSQYIFNSSNKEIWDNLKESCLSCNKGASSPITWWAELPGNAKAGHCYPVCAGIDEAVCTDYNDPNCKRQFQGGDGTCYPCNYNRTVGIGGQSRLIDLCKKCGRDTADNAKFCVYKQTCKPVGELFTVSYDCQACPTESRVAYIPPTDKDLCISRCKKKNGVYSLDEDAVVTTALPEVMPKHHANRCMALCKKGTFMTQRGCIPCGAHASSGNFNLWIKDFPCDEACAGLGKDKEMFVYGPRDGYSWAYCLPKKGCPDLADGTKQIFAGAGTCTPCSQNQNIHDALVIDGVNSCQTCGNRIISGRECFKAEPGKYMICNSVANVPDYLNDDIKNRAKDYKEGKYDGKKTRYQTPSSPGKFLNTSTGECISCDANESVPSTLAECLTCGNRRYETGKCIYGLCAEKEAFLNNNGSCTSCTSSVVRTQILDTDASTRLCNGCADKRVMTTIDKTYCVADCAPGQWQDLNGTCRTDTGGAEIGTDEASRALCRNVGHIAYSKSDADKKIHWYCSQKPQANKFINISGGNANCSAERTEIPNTQDAKNLCLGEYGDGLGCVSVERFVKTDEDGRVYCVK